MTSSLPQVQEQQGRPIGRRPVSVRKGSGGRELGGQGARVAGAPRLEMQAGQSGGGDAYLSCDPARRRSRNIPNPGLEVGVEIRRPEAEGQAVSRGLRREYNYLFRQTLCVQCLHDWAPFPHSSSTFLWSVHAHRALYAARACNRGVGPWARCRERSAPGLSNVRRPTRFIWPVPARRARPGPRSPSRAAISPSSEGLSGPHHADKNEF